MWPYGELWRFDGENWETHANFFTPTAQPPEAPYEFEALNAGLAYNVLGQRIQSLVTYDGFLWLTTASKGTYLSLEEIKRIGVSPRALAEYGQLHQILDSRCAK